MGQHVCWPRARIGSLASRRRSMGQVSEEFRGCRQRGRGGRKVTATAETRSLIQTGAAAGTQELELADRGAISQLLYLVRTLGAAHEYRLQLCVLAMALVIVVGAIAYGQIRLNAWNGSFMDLLARRELAALGGSLVAFFCDRRRTSAARRVADLAPGDDQGKAARVAYARST